MTMTLESKGLGLSGVEHLDHDNGSKSDYPIACDRKPKKH